MLHVAARRHLGVPFQHQGRNPDSALDCVGLLVVSLRACGWPGEDVTAYGRDPVGGLLESHLRREFGAPVADLQPGDIVAMRGRGPVRHVAIVGDHPQGLSLIHACSAAGRVVEQRMDDRLRRLVRHVFRPEVRA